MDKVVSQADKYVTISNAFSEKKKLLRYHLRALTVSGVPERVGGDELGPAEDDVVVPLLTTLVDGGQQLLELIVDDPHPHLKKSKARSQDSQLKLSSSETKTVPNNPSARNRCSVVKEVLSYNLR